MGRLGPLTSQALGRSPYDEVFEGEGVEAAPGPSRQTYDSRGRPVNSETKRIHRDMVRAHNEVMQVIGVAEADNSAALEAEQQRRHQKYEDALGEKILNYGRVSLVHGVWGLVGVKQRILLYKSYAHVRFMDLFWYERSQSSIPRMLFAGYPAHFMEDGLRQLTIHAYTYVGASNYWVDTAVWYLRTHIRAYIVLQRLNIIPASQWLPHPSFFVPFTETSLIPPLPTLEDFTGPSLVRWLGGFCLNMAPVACFCIWSHLWGDAYEHAWTWLLERLPSTAQGKKEAKDLAPLHPDTLRAIEESIRTAAETPELPNPFSDPPPDPPPPAEGGSLTPTDPPPLLLPPPPPESSRRQSTVSARGDDYPSEDEDHEPINPTVISFDIEATDNADAPPGGLWSAELRPSLGPDAARALAGARPTYVNNMLTQLPTVFAVDVLARAATDVLALPLEAATLHLLGAQFRGRAGWPAGDFIGLGDVTWRYVTNLVGIEVLILAAALDVWAAVTLVSQSFHLTEDEWREEQAKKAAEQVTFVTA